MRATAWILGCWWEAAAAMGCGQSLEESSAPAPGGSGGSPAVPSSAGDDNAGLAPLPEVEGEGEGESTDGLHAPVTCTPVGPNGRIARFVPVDANATGSATL